MRAVGEPKSTARLTALDRATNVKTSVLLAGFLATLLLFTALGAIQVRVADPWTAAASATAGVITFGLLTATIVVGSLVVLPGHFRKRTRVLLRGGHQGLATLTTMFLVAHIWAALSIPFFGLTVRELFIFGNHARVFTLLGSMALNLLIVILVMSAALAGLSSMRATRRLRQRIWLAWRKSHWLVYPLWITAMIHTWMVPTQTPNGRALLTVYVLACAMIGMSAIVCRAVLPRANR